MLDSFGITAYQFVNVTGLPNEYVPEDLRYPGSKETDENCMSAHDVAVIADKLLTNYPEILDFSGQSVVTFREGTADETQMINYNAMLPGLAYERPGVVGLKTGSGENAGRNVVLAAEEDGRRVLAVVMKSGAWNEPPTTLFETADRLLDESFDGYETLNLTADNLAVVAEAHVANGKEKTVPLEAAGSLNVTIPKDATENAYNITFTPSQELTNDDDVLLAPIEVGQAVGQYRVETADTLGYLYDDTALTTVDAKASATVKKANIFIRSWRRLRAAVKSLWHRTTATVIVAN